MIKVEIVHPIKFTDKIWIGVKINDTGMLIARPMVRNAQKKEVKYAALVSSNKLFNTA